MRFPSLLALLMAMFIVGKAVADPFVGHFEGDIDGVSHELIVYSDSAGVYDGELHTKEDRRPVFGNRYGEYLIGKMGFPEGQFEFRARIMGAILMIERKSGPPLRFFRKTD